MPTRHPAQPQLDGLSRLIVRRSIDAAPAAVAAAVSGSDADWLGPEVIGAPPGMRRHATDLELHAGEAGGPLHFRKAAYLDLGTPRRIRERWEVEIGWRASTLAPLFPVFSGRLIVRPGEVSLSGWYAPPGGALGRLADAMLLKLAARGTGTWFLGRLEAEASRRTEAIRLG